MNRTGVVAIRSIMVLLLAAVFVQVDAQVRIGLPDARGAQGDTVLVPVTIDDVTGLNVLAYQFVVAFDKSVITVLDVMTAQTLSSQPTWTVMRNVYADSIRVGGFGAYAIAGGGTLVKLKLFVKGHTGSSSVLRYSSVLINAGNPWVSWTDGSFTVAPATGVNQRTGDGLPKAFIVEQNYPNPFNPSTMIAFSLPTNAHVSLKVYTASGKEVAVLVSQELPAGSYHRLWNAASCPSGVYFYRLQAGGYSETKRLSLIK